MLDQESHFMLTLNLPLSDLYPIPLFQSHTTNGEYDSSQSHWNNIDVM